MIDKEKELLYAWMGGFIDGEGTITLCSNSRRKQFVPKIAVSNTNKKMIDVFSKEFGGKTRLRNYNNRLGKEKWKPCYEWSLTYNKALYVIKMLKPFLKLKRKQAHIVLKIRVIKNKNLAAKQRWNPLFKERLIAFTTRLKYKLSILNKRGI